MLFAFVVYVCFRDLLSATIDRSKGVYFLELYINHQSSTLFSISIITFVRMCPLVYVVELLLKIFYFLFLRKQKIC